MKHNDNRPPQPLTNGLVFAIRHKRFRLYLLHRYRYCENHCIGDLVGSWNTDRALAVIGVVIGLLGLIPIFRDASTQERILYAIVLTLLLAAFAILYRSGRGPQYSTTIVRKTVKFSQEDGSKAYFAREQTIRINYGSMAEIWCRNIVADGSIQNVLVDNQAPLPDDQRKLGCLLDVRKRFSSTLYKGQETTICWSYDLIDSFLGRTEFIEHEVTPATHLVELVVELPAGAARMFRNPKLEERVAGEPSRSLLDPQIAQNGHVIHTKIKAPHPGRTIRLSRDW